MWAARDWETGPVGGPRTGGDKSHQRTVAGRAEAPLQVSSPWLPASAPGTQQVDYGGRLPGQITTAVQSCHLTFPCKAHTGLLTKHPCHRPSSSSPLEMSSCCGFMCVHSSPCAAVVPLAGGQSAHGRPGAGMSGCRCHTDASFLHQDWLPETVHVWGSRCVSARVSFSCSVDTSVTHVLCCV